MKTLLHGLVAGLLLLFVYSEAHAATTPKLFTNTEGLFYQDKQGLTSKLATNDPNLYKTLKQKSIPISTNELYQIPIGTPSINTFERDTDQDGLDDEYERAFGTNPQKKDTDQDGFQDTPEILQGYDPLRKLKKLVLNRSLYLKYQGQFVWENRTKQVWFISPSTPKRFFITSRPNLAARYLEALATKQPNTTPPSNVCLPESCTQLDWKTRAQRLTLPNYQKRRDTNNKLVLQSQNFQLVMPNETPNAEEFARIKLYELRRAYENTERLLGRAPFLLPEAIKEEYVLNLSHTGSCCGSAEEGLPIMWNIGSPADYAKTISLEDPNTEYYKNADWSKVRGNHELTHRFVRGLNLSSFLDEGLAMYAQDHGGPQPMACGQGGYTQGNTRTAYTFLCRNDPGMTRIYNSGDCFWQRIEEKYGQDMIKRIISRIYNKDERDALQSYIPSPGSSPTVRWNSFSGELLIDVQQAFIPEIGPRFWQDFQDFGLSPTMAEGLTYESELIRAGCAT